QPYVTRSRAEEGTKKSSADFGRYSRPVVTNTPVNVAGKWIGARLKGDLATSRLAGISQKTLPDLSHPIRIGADHGRLVTQSRQLKMGVAPAGGLRELARQAGQVHRLPIQPQGTKKILDFIKELTTAFRPLAQSSQNFPFGLPLQRQTGFQDGHARI